jgi:hypothetical protein
MLTFLGMQFSPVPSPLLDPNIFLSTIKHAHRVIFLESHSGNGTVRLLACFYCSVTSAVVD